ncbi:MAG: hypothetical protein JWN15_253 [Firmicutes bacterium]|nr:hypothetical protein [Bacillota bacterium]
MRWNWRVLVGLLLYLGTLGVVFWMLPDYLVGMSGGALTHKQATLPVVVAGWMGVLAVIVGVWLGRHDAKPSRKDPG